MDGRYAKSLAELAVKYAVAEQGLQAEFEPGAVLVKCSRGSFRFYYDFDAAQPDDSFVNVPLFHWRCKRRYQELKNILDAGMIREPVAMRVKHIVPRDMLAGTLHALLTQEADLAGFILGHAVAEVFADLRGDDYMNCIASTDNGIKISMELGFLPDGSEPVLLHEIVAKTGIASDVTVDTQTQQYPVYVFRGKETITYNDIDDELYGFEPVQADSLRFILWALSDPARLEELRRSAGHEAMVWAAATRSAENIQVEKVST